MRPWISPEGTLDTRRAGRLHWYIFIWIICIGLSLLLVGIRRDLPFTPEIDEPTFVVSAVQIVGSGNLNPGWFGHPGSTVIYPLALIYHLRHVALEGGPLFQAAPAIHDVFKADPSRFYLFGRLLIVAYTAGMLPFVYLLGRRAFSPLAGLIGMWIVCILPLVVSYGQMIRTDSAATFFGVISLWLCLKLLDRPRLAYHVGAGAAIGLAIATRYFMVALVPVLLLVDGILIWNSLRQRQRPIKHVLHGLAGLLCIPLAFIIATPYFLLDLSTVLINIRHEARSGHAGADGLTPLGNARWYLTRALPQTMSWPLMLCAALGAGLSFWRRRMQQIIPGIFVAIFFTGICLSPLHWDRWIIPCLPVLALYAAHAMIISLRYLAAATHWRSALQSWAIAAAVLLATIWPAYRVVVMDLRQLQPSTRIEARYWIQEHLPESSSIAQEAYTAPLAGTRFRVTERFMLAGGRTLADYQRDGYDYLVVSSSIYYRFFAVPERYPQEVAFYQTLFSEGREVYQITPSRFQNGPTIRIFAIQQ